MNSTINKMTGEFTLAIDVSVPESNAILRNRVLGQEIQPELVCPSEVRCPRAYKRFRDPETKAAFRTRLQDVLRAAWATAAGDEAADGLVRSFASLAQTVERDGAIVFGDLLARPAFKRLVAAYDRVMSDAGSVSLLHAYLDLRNHPEFLGNTDFSDAFIHPLAVALIAHRVGGPVRVVDARAKDAQPLTVRAQDNMLHIDNTPFNDEFKVLLTWEKGKASGPKGQNFVFLPGTHHGARDCFVNGDGLAWSTENGSIFITGESIEKVFAFQGRVRPEGAPAVVEVHDPDRPLTTVFAAGSLVHHRYRTEAGHARSCIIVAFHPVADNPGAFMDRPGTGIGDPLHRTLFGQQDATGRAFLDMVAAHAVGIGRKLVEIDSAKAGTVVLNQGEEMLTAAELREWKTIATAAPEIEDLKRGRQGFPHGATVTLDEFVREVGPSMMLYDKHGPLDLILYDDSHEESRKWARNRIREMRMDRLTSRLRAWEGEVRQPTLRDVMPVDGLADAARQLADWIDALGDVERAQGQVDRWERISPESAYRSVRQLAEDLGEAIRRCYSSQNFLSTGLFLFWAYDEAMRLGQRGPETLRGAGGRLLRHYIATAILVHQSYGT